MKKLFGLLVLIGLAPMAFGMELSKMGEYLKYRNTLPEEVLPYVASVEVAVITKLEKHTDCFNIIAPFLFYSLHQTIIPWVVTKTASEKGRTSIENYVSNISQKYVSREDSPFWILAYFSSCDDSVSWNCALL